MDFYTDEHFQIGSTHNASGKPCQDYAVSGVENGRAYAVVSDGCSTGGRTDIGARLICLAAATALRTHAQRGSEVTPTTPDEIALHEHIVLSGVQQTLGLTLDDLLATCITAYVTPEGGFVHLQGDGVIALVKHDGGLLFQKYEWRGNTPFYPAYRNGRLAAFTAAHGGDPAALALDLEEWSWDPRSGEEDSLTDTEQYSLAEGMKGIAGLIDPNIYAYVAIFSDGVTQVEGIDWKDAVRELLAFKSLEGSFAKRRMIRFVHNAQKNGKGPLDDIAYAVIRVEQSTEGNDNDSVESES